MMVYILHPFVWHTLERVYASVGWSASLPALYLLPVLVVIITIILALLYHRVTSPRMAAAS